MLGNVLRKFILMLYDALWIAWKVMKKEESKKEGRISQGRKNRVHCGSWDFAWDKRLFQTGFFTYVLYCSNRRGFLPVFFLVGLTCALYLHYVDFKSLH